MSKMSPKEFLELLPLMRALMMPNHDEPHDPCPPSPPPADLPERAVIVCTAKRWVGFGYARDCAGASVFLRGSRCAIKFGTTGGIGELANAGPTSKSRVGDRCDVLLHDVTAVFHVTPTAVEAWEAWTRT